MCVFAHNPSALLNAVRVFAARLPANRWFPPHVVVLCQERAQNHHKKYYMNLFSEEYAFDRGKSWRAFK